MASCSVSSVVITKQGNQLLLNFLVTIRMGNTVLFRSPIIPISAKEAQIIRNGFKPTCSVEVTRSVIVGTTNYEELLITLRIPRKVVRMTGAARAARAARA